MFVNFVKNDLPRVPIYNTTEDFTPGKNHMVAIFVKNDSPAVFELSHEKSPLTICN